MIHSLTCSNFYSIGDSVKLDFSVDRNAPDKPTYVSPTPDTRVSLIESIIGSNSSGKTNVLKVIAFAQWLIVDAYSYDPDSVIPVRTFLNQDNKLTFISIVFSIDNNLYTYDFELGVERIFSEKISVKTKSSERVTTKQLFFRKWDQQLNKYEVKDSVFGVSKDKLRMNSSVIATAYRDGNELATSIARNWRDLVTTNVVEHGYKHFAHDQHNRHAIVAIKSFYEDEELKSKVESILRKFDIGFGEFTRHQVQETTIFGIKHQFGDVNYELPFQYESSGTKQAIIILRYVLPALLAGGTAVIDELDANLHPAIVEEILSMFASPETNPKNAQIIFSSHTPTVLTSLDKYQITFVEKDDRAQTQVWRLDSIKGVRSDDNYYAKYISGAYGATPDIG